MNRLDNRCVLEERDADEADDPGDISDAEPEVDAASLMDAEAPPDAASGSILDLDATAPLDSSANGAFDDARPPSDTDATLASNDARSPGADAAPNACGSLDAAFCADFEQGTLEVFSWQELTPGTLASVGLVDGGTAPGGLALRSALDGTADESARVVVKLHDGAPSWFRASFDFLPSLSLPAEGDEPIFWFRLTEESEDAYRGVFLGSLRAGTQLIVQNFDGVSETWDSYPAAALPSGWIHVELELQLGRQGSAKLRFNGAVALAHTGPIHVTNVEHSFVQLGLYSEPATVSSALYDNVVIEFAP